MGSDSPAVLQAAVLVSGGADAELPSPRRGELPVTCAEQGWTWGLGPSGDLSTWLLVSDFYS